MYAVDSYAAVRRFVFVEGKSRREAARVFGLSRDTISKMCQFSAPPGYVCQSARNGDPGPACKKDPRGSILLFGSAVASFRPGTCFR